MFKTLFIFISLYVIITILPSAYSQLSDDIGVQLSKTCIQMVRYNLTTNCPTYEEIMFLFTDTSDQRISGQFVFEDGYLHRGHSNYTDSYQFYRFDTQKRFWVDPPPKVAEGIKLIIIESRIDEYKIGQQIISNFSVQVGHDRYVDSCRVARITATDWQFLLGDTVRYMGNGCNKAFTNFDEIITKRWEKAIHDITTSYKYQLEKWIADSLAKCGQKVCFYEKDHVQIYR